jgi:hypothetical protein
VPVYEVLQKIAFEKRVKIHDPVLEGTDAVVALASLSVGRKSWDREDTVKHTGEPRRRVSRHPYVPGCGLPRLNLVRSLVDTNGAPLSRRPQRR